MRVKANGSNGVPKSVGKVPKPEYIHREYASLARQKASIVICTRNRADYLKTALESLFAERGDPDMYEVIVIDNASADDTHVICRPYLSQYDHFRHVVEPRVGISSARNRGYKEAKHDWIAYLDDDVLVKPGYLDRLFHIINNHTYDCVGGVYEPWYRHGKPKWLKDEYVSHTSTMKGIGVLQKGYASAGIMVIKKTMLEKFGGFSERLGMHDTKLAYGEESHLQYRMRLQGHIIGFDPDWQVYHAVRKEKLSILWFIRSFYARGRDSVYAYNKQAGFFESVKDLGQSVRKTCIYCVRHIRNLFKHDYHIGNWFLDSAKPMALGIGVFAGRLSCLYAGKSERNERDIC
jgi:glycosyltransferase involved in cell wall biosynthesis